MATPKQLAHIQKLATSPEVKEKQRLAKLGKKRAGNPIKWRHTEESKLKNSLAHRGEQGSGWRGGLTSLIRLIRSGIKYRTWRMQVFVRDGFRCTWCDRDKVYLNADHIVQFSALLRQNNIKTLEEAENCEALWNITNGRTLCVECHKKTDTYLNKGKEYLKNHDL